MGVIFFSTLLAVALGLGVRSKIRKNMERQKRAFLPQPDFSENGLPDPEAVRFGEAVQFGKEKMVPAKFEEMPEDEFPVSDEAFFASGVDFEGDIASELWEVDNRETLEKEKDTPTERKENVLSCKEDSAKDRISLREAIIAQAVLERKCL